MTTTPADELRTAAIAIRCKANAATPGPWVADESEIYNSDTDWVGETLQTGDWDTTRANSEHMASWHPAVALAVADWLDYAADKWGDTDPMFIGRGVHVDAALKVARSYLGTTEQVTA